jgi:putative membrane protein
MTSPAAPSPLPSPRVFAAINFALTTAVLAFLFWLIYGNAGSDAETRAATSRLPAVNAAFNSLSAGLVAAAFVAIKRGHRRLHAGLMLGGVACSGLFLATYVYYHLHHGDTPFTGTGWIRPVYYSVLISHIVLSMFAFPMILTSLFLAATRRFRLHVRVSRYTWAAWMYVSVTGVLVFYMLHG